MPTPTFTVLVLLTSSVIKIGTNSEMNASSSYVSCLSDESTPPMIS